MTLKTHYVKTVPPVMQIKPRGKSLANINFAEIASLFDKRKWEKN